LSDRKSNQDNEKYCFQCSFIQPMTERYAIHK
jgi:hypothetical protein